jgi:hypothetical protein
VKLLISYQIQLRLLEGFTESLGYPDRCWYNCHLWSGLFNDDYTTSNSRAIMNDEFEMILMESWHSVI